MSSGQHVCRSGKPPPQPTTVEVFRLARGFSRPHAGRTAQPLAQVKSSLLGKADRPKTLSPRHVRHGASPHVSMTLKPPPPTHTHTHTLSLSLPLPVLLQGSALGSSTGLLGLPGPFKRHPAARGATDRGFFHARRYVTSSRPNAPSSPPAEVEAGSDVFATGARAARAARETGVEGQRPRAVALPGSLRMARQDARFAAVKQASGPWSFGPRGRESFCNSEAP